MALVGADDNFHIIIKAYFILCDSHIFYFSQFNIKDYYFLILFSSQSLILGKSSTKWMGDYIYMHV